MKRIVTLVAAFAVVSAVSFFGAKHLRSQELLRATRTPFTIQMHERSVTVDTGETLERESFWARRSDGSLSDGFYTALPTGGITLTRTVTLVPAKKRVVVHDLTGSTMTQSLSTSQVLAVKAGPADPTCRSHPERMQHFQVLGEGEYLGFHIVKLSSQSDDGMEELWEAPALDCAALYIKHQLRNRDGSGKVWAIAEKTAVKVVSGEPSTDLFAVPSQFTEVSPSTLVEEAAKREGGVLSDNVRKRLSSLDHAYYASRTAAPK